MNKYNIVPTGKFKKDFKLAKKSGYDISLLSIVVNTIAEGNLFLYLTRPGTHSDLF